MSSSHKQQQQRSGTAGYSQQKSKTQLVASEGVVTVHEVTEQRSLAPVGRSA